MDHQLHLGCSSWNVNSTSPPRLSELKFHPPASLNLSQWEHEYQTGHISTQLWGPLCTPSNSIPSHCPPSPIIAGMNRRRSLLVVRSSFFKRTAIPTYSWLYITDSPEVTGSASIFPTSTKNSQSTFTPQASSSSSVSSNSSRKGNSNIGPISGGTAGGIAVATLIAAIVSCITIRRRRARSVQVAVTYPLTMIETPKLYVRTFSFSPGYVETPETG